jgi:hypothetical protein
MSALERLNAYLGRERIEWLEKKAKELKLSGASDLLRRIIDDYRRKDSKK